MVSIGGFALRLIGASAVEAEVENVLFLCAKVQAEWQIL